jgi:hypothetical protein
MKSLGSWAQGGWVKEGTLLPEVLRFESEPCAGWIRMVPVLMVSGIWALLGVYSGTLFGSSWRLRLDVSVRLYLCNWRSFKPPSSCHFSLQGH